MNTIQEGKDYLAKNAANGVNCPCCKQIVKLYKRKLNSGMAYVLIAIYGIDKTLNPQDGWFHVTKECSSRRVNAMGLEYSKLRHWGFIEPRGDAPTSGARFSGYWRITQAGKDFVKGGVFVSKYVYLYNKERVTGTDNTTINIKEALGDKFDYAQLMQAAA